MPAPFPYVYTEITRHGRPSVYYRRGKGVRVRLPDSIGSEEFLRAYAEAPNVSPREKRTGAASRDIAPIANVMIPTLRGAAHRARERGLDFDLTEQWCIDTLTAQDGRCALTGMRFSLARLGMRGRDPYGPSLDRIDCKVGYTPENTRIVLLAVNIMLADWGEDVFRRVIAAYAKHNLPIR